MNALLLALLAVVAVSAFVLAWTFTSARRRGEQSVPVSSGIAAVVTFVAAVVYSIQSADGGWGVRLAGVGVLFVALVLGAWAGRRGPAQA